MVSSEPVYGVHDLRQGSPVAPKDISIDLICVHGLGGHAYKTWTHSQTGTFWIRDLLPDRLPGVRTLVFGFNAKKQKHNAELDFQDVATQLIAGLDSHRTHEEEQARPIIFLAHSLGGLIVKKAVTISTPPAKLISACAKGFVFFATPHCGSHLADFVSTFEIFSKIIVDPPNNFIRDLCTSSPNLLQLDSDFKSFVQERCIPCTSFYEGEKTKKVFWRGTKIVEKSSAKLFIEHEEAICLNGDHMNLVKFKNSNDEKFRIVLGRLKSLVDKIRNAPKRRKSHNNIFVPFRPGRYFIGRQEELETLHSLLGDEENYVPQAVALHGVGGVGKTQLALKYAIDHAHLYEWVFFANAACAEVLRNDFRQMQHRVCESVDKDENFVDKILAWLVSRDDPWLLILDNANHLQDVSPYLSRLVHRGHIIVTTQDSRVHENEFIGAALHVRSLSPEASQELLFARSGLDPSDEEEARAARTLLEDIGHLPLAIDSAGAYMSVRKKSVTEYTWLFHEYQKELLDQPRPPASSYDRSVSGALEVNFKEIDARPDASALLCLLIFLNRAEVTEAFLKRGVTKQQCWGPNGEPITVTPQESYVPGALIELINNPIRLDDALEDLISLSIITFTGRNVDGRSFMLHPLYHKCAKHRMSKELRRKHCAEALMFLAHAFPTDEYMLEKSDGVLTRSFIPHIIYAYESFRHHDNDLTIEFLESFASPHHVAGSLRPREVVAKLVLDGDLTYGQGEPKKNAYLLAWVDILLKTSPNMVLKARALSVELVITYYESGNYAGGIRACEAFLRSVKQAQETGQTAIDELTNAEIGIIQSTLAELLVTEVGSDSDKFAQSKALLQSWSPLNPNAPSRKEKFALGAQARILGKLLKDHGEWAESETQFRLYLDRYATRGTQPEGWSAGDLAHTLMEQNRPGEAEAILRGCLQPRQARQTPEMKARDRRSDTMYLEMLLGESLLLQGKYDESEALMQRLLEHFFSFGEDLWHFEKFRVAFVMTILARVHHLKGDFYPAIMYWNQMIDYCESKMDVDEQRGKWDRNSFMPLIAELSLSDCYFELGKADIGMPRRHHSMGLLDVANGQSWILGLGTYWLELLKAKAKKRDM